jgi:hypothetical protein
VALAALGGNEVRSVALGVAVELAVAVADLVSGEWRPMVGRRTVRRMFRCTFIAGSLQIHCTFVAGSLRFRCTFIAGSLQIHCTFIAGSLQIHCTFVAGSLQIHCTFVAGSLQIHCTFVAGSLQIHCGFVAGGMSPAMQSIFSRGKRERESSRVGLGRGLRLRAGESVGFARFALSPRSRIHRTVPPAWFTV